MAKGSKVQDAASLTRALAALIEDGAMYVPETITMDSGEMIPLDGDPYPHTIHRSCERCGRHATWQRPLMHAFGRVAPGSGGHIPFRVNIAGADLLLFECCNCNPRASYFSWPMHIAEGAFGVWIRRQGKGTMTATLAGVQGIAVSERPVSRAVTFTKVGQTDQPSPVPDADVAAMLQGESAILYRRALTSLAHGFGLGAVAYLRRVVEDTTEKLIDALESAAKDEADAETMRLIAEARESAHQSARLALVANADPVALRLAGGNPLKALYGAFSEGVHNKTDAECHAVATDLRETFELVIRRLRGRERDLAALKRLRTRLRR